MSESPHKTANAPTMTTTPITKPADDDTTTEIYCRVKGVRALEIDILGNLMEVNNGQITTINAAPALFSLPEGADFYATVTTNQLTAELTPGKVITSATTKQVEAAEKRRVSWDKLMRRAAPTAGLEKVLDYDFGRDLELLIGLGRSVAKWYTIASVTLWGLHAVGIMRRR
ncbi:hypothetical protein BJ508DRAFT_57809 [Ascobolus immersus RN42]|uniref:Uncharacterized protein n=1 Tax=Ascobolus immersus RN42 TaxID=1160509 RepID=A0A3N4HFX7_ASCIM|nr:hypothetical protein BJ508DRAFT_57809 [Ascobolus immersus RN42]